MWSWLTGVCVGHGFSESKLMTLVSVCVEVEYIVVKVDGLLLQVFIRQGEKGFAANLHM